MAEEFDLVVIGSGAGGAPVAHELAKAGHSVLVLEKGPLIVPQYQGQSGLSDFKRDELIADGPKKIIDNPTLANNGEGYYSSHVEPDLNDEPHVYQGQDNRDRATIEGYTAQVVGGGTQLYGGVSFRFTPTDLRLRSFNEGRTDIQADPNGDVQREARDWPISYDELEPFYCKAEELVGINGTHENQLKPFSRQTYQPPLSPNGISQYALEGMTYLGQTLADKLGSEAAKPYRTPLAVITRDHAPSGRKAPPDPETARTSYVNRYGDPLGLKSNTWVSLLSPVKDLPNFQIRCNCVVTSLKAAGNRIDEVEYLDPSGATRAVRGKLVVVACSAIESIRLLKLSARRDGNFSDRINKSGLLGNYFLTHCFGGARAVMPERFDKSQALDADWATDACATEAYLRSTGLWAGGGIYNNTSDSALPLSLLRTHGSQDLDTLWRGFAGDSSLKGDALMAFLDAEFGRGLSVSFMANQVPLRDNRIELHSSVKDKWGRPVAYVVKRWHSHDMHVMNTLANECANVLRFGGDTATRNYPIAGAGGVYQAENARARVANHILGGARFGTDPQDSVLDPSCRAWEIDNLYLTDGSFMPTSGGGNPTLTIQANAFRVAEHLLGRA